MSSRMHSKRSRSRDRGSPGRRRPLDRASPDRNDRVRQRELDSPKTSYRGRRDSPPKARNNNFDSPRRSLRRDYDSPVRPRRKDLNSPPRSRRNDLDDGCARAGRDGDRRGDIGGPAGLVFLCSNSTKSDCFHYRVFGLPSAQRDIVERVVMGTKLFLFNLDSKELFGIFEAASAGGMILVPEAFGEFKGSYSAQVRFRIHRECLPLRFDIVRDVLKENFSQRGKFDCELTADQVLKLTQFFSPPDTRSQNAEKKLGSRWDNERPVQEVQASVGVGGLPFKQDGYMTSGIRRPQLYENTDINLSSRNPLSDVSHLAGNKIIGEGGYPNPTAVLGQGQMEEVDQLALKYLQNDPGFLGIRLDPVNSFLSNSAGYSRDPLHLSMHGLLNSQMEHVQMEDHSNYPRVGMQPFSGMHPGQNFIGGVGGMQGFPSRMWDSLGHQTNIQPHVFRELGGISNAIGPFGIGGSLPLSVNVGASNTNVINSAPQGNVKGYPLGSTLGLPGVPSNANFSTPTAASNAAAEYQMRAGGGTMASKPGVFFLPGTGLLPLPGTFGNVSAIGPPFPMASTSGAAAAAHMIPSHILNNPQVPASSTQALGPTNKAKQTGRKKKDRSLLVEGSQTASGTADVNEK